ncbi:MAG: hypothetical protein LBQ95_03340 [Lachnospiraceae bacterium]|jgi:hypothetical protein|nr:hypothetical protein [Lachnospiraceae bacterium]
MGEILIFLFEETIKYPLGVIAILIALTLLIALIVRDYNNNKKYNQLINEQKPIEVQKTNGGKKTREQLIREIKEREQKHTKSKSKKPEKDIDELIYEQFGINFKTFNPTGRSPQDYHNNRRGGYYDYDMDDDGGYSDYYEEYSSNDDESSEYDDEYSDSGSYESEGSGSIWGILGALSDISFGKHKETHTKTKPEKRTRTESPYRAMKRGYDDGYNAGTYGKYSLFRETSRSKKNETKADKWYRKGFRDGFDDEEMDEDDGW